MHYMNELDIRKPLEVYISERSEELRIHQQTGLEFDDFRSWLGRRIFN
jgi:hypothetical protein